MLFIFGAIVSVFSSGDSEEANAPASGATTEETQEEATRESAQREQTEAAEASRDRTEQQVQPQTPQERLHSKIEEVFVSPSADPKVAIGNSPSGCWQIDVNYSTERATGISYQMQDVYEAVYGDQELSRYVCGMTVNAYGVRRDNYGQPYTELYYSTTMNRDVAQRVNWAEPYTVNFENIWILNYKHPVVEQEEARQEAERIIDCAVDEGFFDNWLCP